MICLSCGDCCMHMSPLSPADVPCPRVIQEDTFVFCSNYHERPDQCYNHDFPSRVCPIGMSVLNLHTKEECIERYKESLNRIYKL